MTDMRHYLNLLNESSSPKASRASLAEAEFSYRLRALTESLKEEADGGKSKSRRLRLAAIAAAAGALAAGIQGMADDGGYTNWGEDGTWGPEAPGADDQTVWPVDFDKVNESLTEGRMSKKKLAMLAAAAGAIAAAAHGLAGDGGSGGGEWGDEYGSYSPGYEDVPDGYSPPDMPFPEENAICYPEIPPQGIEDDPSDRRIRCG